MAISSFVSLPSEDAALRASTLARRPGCSSPMFDYVSHPNVHELEFALEGNAMVIMPDKAYKLSPRIARYNPELQPSKTFNYTDENLKLLVWYSTGRLANVGRIQNHAVQFECRNL